MFFPNVAVDDIAQHIDQAKHEIVIESQSAYSARLIVAISSAVKRGVKVKVSIGPRPTVDITATGMPMVGSNPFLLASGQEMDAFAKAGANIQVNAKFNEISGSVARPGVETHASFIVVDDGWSVICNGAFSDKAMATMVNSCWSGPDQRVANSLKSAFYLDWFDDDAPPTDPVSLTASAVKSIILSPNSSAAIIHMINIPGPVSIRAGKIDSYVPIVNAIIAKGKDARLLLTDNPRSSQKTIELLKAKGVNVQLTKAKFDGLLIISGKTVFLGSQRLTGDSLSKSREVGLMLPGDDSDTAIARFEENWANK